MLPFIVPILQMRKQGLKEMAEPEAELGPVKVHIVLFPPYPVTVIPGQMGGLKLNTGSKEAASMWFSLPPFHENDF